MQMQDKKRFIISYVTNEKSSKVISFLYDLIISLQKKLGSGS